MRNIVDKCSPTGCLIPYESDKLTLLHNGREIHEDDIKDMRGIITCNKTYWNENVKDDCVERSTGQAPGSTPRQCPHYVDTTGTFLTGNVKPQEIKGYLTFEKHNTRCPDTDSKWWIR